MNPVKTYQSLLYKLPCFSVGLFSNSPIGYALNILQRRKLLKARYNNWFNYLRIQGYTIIINYMTKEDCRKVI